MSTLHQSSLVQDLEKSCVYITIRMRKELKTAYFMVKIYTSYFSCVNAYLNCHAIYKLV